MADPSELIDQLPIIEDQLAAFEDEPNYDYDDVEYSSSDEESIDSDLLLINAQLQWEESLSQLTTLLQIVILPLLGKVIGKRVAGMIWRKAWDLFSY